MDHIYCNTYFFRIITKLRLSLFFIELCFSLYLDSIIWIIEQYFFITCKYLFYVYVLIVISQCTSFFFLRFINNIYINFITHFFIIGSLTWLLIYFYYGHNIIPYYGHVCTTDFDNIINATINESFCTYINNNSDYFTYVTVDKNYLDKIRYHLFCNLNSDLTILDIQQVSLIFFSENHKLHFTSELYPVWYWYDLYYNIHIDSDFSWIRLLILIML